MNPSQNAHLILRGLTKFADVHHQHMVNKGYWLPGDDTPKLMGLKMARIHGEVSELVEVYRKDLMHEPSDKKIELVYSYDGTPPTTGRKYLTNEEEEFADIILQTLDAAATRGIDIEVAVQSKAKYNWERPSAKEQGKAF